MAFFVANRLSEDIVPLKSTYKYFNVDNIQKEDYSVNTKGADHRGIKMTREYIRTFFSIMIADCSGKGRKTGRST